MATAARDRLARALRGDAQTVSSVELMAKPDGLRLEVEGFGPVRFPVTPYTLVLTKTDALFAREQAARARDETDLEWLAAQWNPGA